MLHMLDMLHEWNWAFQPHAIEAGNVANRKGSCTPGGLFRKSGDIIAKVLRRPLTIIQHNRPRVVLLSMDDDERLMCQWERRPAATHRTMSGALSLASGEAVDATPGLKTSR
jgi:PHD/YefM family antitoxin component YafN of YafNO toxin-antitoxin module